jgi:hypothetical protein
VDLSQAVPISEFWGSWLVVACGWQTATSAFVNPIFLAFHGVDLVF